MESIDNIFFIIEVDGSGVPLCLTGKELNIYMHYVGEGHYPISV
jgi:hypothetical protein